MSRGSATAPQAVFLAAVLSLSLCACSTNPITGRDQFVGMPAVQAHADLSYAVSSKAQRFQAVEACDHACRAQERAFEAQVRRLGAQLETAARNMSPELFERIRSFEVAVAPDLGAATGSSAGGRIVLGAGLARLEPADDVTAFLLAREMAHVIARHDEEDSGARIFFSAITTLLPVTLIARALASVVGSGALMVSWAEQQRKEADEIALALLVRTGRSISGVARSLAGGVRTDRLPDSDWGRRYGESARRVAVLAESAPQYADFDNWLLHESVQSIERVEICLKAKGGAQTEAELAERRRECMGRSS